jgi:hypothetical protein
MSTCSMRRANQVPERHGPPKRPGGEQTRAAVCTFEPAGSARTNCMAARAVLYGVAQLELR